MSQLALVALLACGPVPEWLHPWDEASRPDDDSEVVDASAPTGDTGRGSTDTAAPPVCPFTPCGGDFAGSWEFRATCAGGTRRDVSGTSCDGLQYTLQTVWDGTLDLRADGTYTLDVSAWTGHATHWVPASCNPTGCADLGSDTLYGDCVDGANGGCVCERTEEVGATLMVGEWWIDDGTTQPAPPELLLGQVYDSWSVAWGVFEWCASGDELQFTDKFDNVWALTRSP